MRLRWWVVLLVAFGGSVEMYELWQLQIARNELSVALQGHDDDNVIMPEIRTIQFLKRNGFTIELSAANYVSVPLTSPPAASTARYPSGDRSLGSGLGIQLKGFVGNPTNLWVSNLSLKFSASRIRYEVINVLEHAKHDSTQTPSPAQPLATHSMARPRPVSGFYANDEFFLFGPEALGEGESVEIEEISPGGRQPFEITVPSRIGGLIDNTSPQRDGIRFTVLFSGERYSPIFAP